ncbi:MAG: hypothetical protein ABW073_02195, partial [Acidimicrobiia bacterium]
VDQRYQGDFVPLLVVGGVVGAWWLAHWLSTRRRWLRAVVIGVVAVLAAWGVWVNAGLTYLYTHTYQPDVGTQELAELIATQLRIHDQLSDGPPSKVLHMDALAKLDVAPAGTLAVVGDCDALLWSNGRGWRTVEQTAATGLYPLRVRLAPARPGTREPLASVVDGDVTTVLWALRGNDGARLQLSWFDGAGVEHVATDDAGRRRSQAIVHDGDLVDVALRLDLGLGLLDLASVALDDEIVLHGFGPMSPGTITYGRQPFPAAGATTVTGTVKPGPRPTTPSCDRIVRSER